MEESRRRWEDEKFRYRQEEAQKIVVRYIRRLSSLYTVKTGYGFIRHIECRTKSWESMQAKLERKGFPVDFDTAIENLNDISGVRIICYTMKEIYWIARQFGKEMVPCTDEGKEIFQVVKVKDFIRKPKKSGYESYHLILDVLVDGESSRETHFDSDKKINNGKNKNSGCLQCPDSVRVELQLRTIGMDAWASLDTMIRYKNQGEFPEECMKKYTRVNKQFDKLIQKMKTLGKNGQNGGNK